jgi:hypothetical protein
VTEMLAEDQLDATDQGRIGTTAPPGASELVYHGDVFAYAVYPSGLVPNERRYAVDPFTGRVAGRIVERIP